MPGLRSRLRLRHAFPLPVPGHVGVPGHPEASNVTVRATAAHSFPDHTDITPTRDRQRMRSGSPAFAR